MLVSERETAVERPCAAGSEQPLCAKTSLNRRQCLRFVCVAQGEWEDGLQHGNGTYRYANGDKYIGAPSIASRRAPNQS